MKKIIGYVVAVFILVVFAGTAIFLYQKSKPKPEAYTLDKVERKTIIQKTIATGKVIPRREIEVKSQVSGVVEKVYVIAGQTVKKGDILAKISLAPNMVQINNAENQLENARINLKNSEEEFKRQKRLFEQKLVSDSEYKKFLLTYELQREAVSSAENNLLLLKSGATKKSDKVSNLIPATVDGMVLDVPNKEGAFIVESSTFSAGTSIASLADMNDMIFEGLVDESEVGKLREGQELLLHIGALPQSTYTANLEYIAPKGTNDQGTIKFQIRAAVKLSSEFFLRANYSANADIVLNRKDNVLAINEGSVLSDDKKSYVEIEVAPNKFERRDIVTGISDGLTIEVVSGLTGTEKIKHH